MNKKKVHAELEIDEMNNSEKKFICLKDDAHIKLIIITCVFLMSIFQLGCSSQPANTSTSTSDIPSSSISTEQGSSSIDSNNIESNQNNADTNSSDSNSAKTKEPKTEEVVTIPSYKEITSNPDKYLNKEFNLKGKVTRADGGYRGSDHKVHIFWDDSNTYGEVIEVVIPSSAFTKNVTPNYIFTANAKFIGFDDDGHPQFKTTSYSCSPPPGSPSYKR